MNRMAVTPGQLRDAPCMLADFQELPAPLLLSRPRELFVAWRPDQVAETLRQAEAAARAGAWVGGYVAYEAAAAFALPAAPAEPGLPLAWFARFERDQEVIFPPVVPPPAPELLLESTRDRYDGQVARILAAVSAGESYQVNLTLSARLAGETSPEGLFLAVQSTQRPPWGAWLFDGETAIASFSPELFLALAGERLVTAPIKGTRPRSGDEAEDARLAAELLASAKERAEHVMIVDMARNDLGRVCRTGSVAVEKLWEPRHFATIHHLETRVTGLRRQGVGLDRLFAALFPAASITGAPKHRTMALIRELEVRPRGVYTGSVCLFRPGGDGWCNVAIRTVVARPGQPGRMGLGGGIVADSQAGAEWDELHHKGAFLRHLPPRPGLLETLRVGAGGEVAGLERHWARLERSARALALSCPRELLERELVRTVAELGGAGLLPRVVRLALEAEGGWSLSHRPLPPVQPELKVCLAPRANDRRDRLLGHKSTRRELWQGWLERAMALGYDDVVMFNGLGHVTEGVIRAVAVKHRGVWRVPPLADGLLPSLWRQEAMARLEAREESVRVEELIQAEMILMGNSVRGEGRVVAVEEVKF